MVGRRKEQQHWEEMAIVSGTSMPTARDPFAQKHIARVEEEIRSVQAENEKINAEIKAEETKIEALSKEIKAYEEQLKGLELRLKDSSTEKNLEIERQKHLVEQRLHNLINYESTLILRIASRAEVLRVLNSIQIVFKILTLGHRSSMEEMLEAIKGHEDRSRDSPIPPVLPVRPTSKARPPSAVRTRKLTQTRFNQSNIEAPGDVQVEVPPVDVQGLCIKKQSENMTNVELNEGDPLANGRCNGAAEVNAECNNGSKVASKPVFIVRPNIDLVMAV